MAISEFKVKEQWLGTGLVTDYTFDFTIQDAKHLLLVLQNASGELVARFRGDDATRLASITFDAKNGGGTVSLLNALDDNFVITALLAPDEPVQPSEFKSKFGFTLELFELALDRLVCQIQRLAYLAGRAVVLNDIDDIDGFDPTLPLGIAAKIGGLISVKDDGTGFESVVTTGMIASAQGYATDAGLAKDAAIISASAAATSAAAAAASALSANSGFAPTGTRALPLDITAAGGITWVGPYRQITFIHGSPGAVTLSGNPQITAGTALGYEITLVGCDDVNTVKLVNGNGLDLNGDCTLGNGDVLGLIWDGTHWSEIYRRSAT